MYSASAHSHRRTQIVKTTPAHNVYICCIGLYKISRARCYIPKTLFLNIFPGSPAHIGVSARSTGQCLGIVLILSLIFSSTCQYVLPFCCLAGADCLLARGNTKLAKFTWSRSTTHRLFLLLSTSYMYTIEKCFHGLASFRQID